MRQAALSLDVPDPVVLTCQQGTNADVFVQILDLYCEPGDTIADVTWGRGAFWSQVTQDRYHVLGTDLQTGTDFRRLPYEDAALTALVLDPPYMAGGAEVKDSLNDCYRNSDERTRSPQDVLRLYAAGVLEAARVLRRGGILILKCQDCVESHVQWLYHVDLITLLGLFGYRIEDLFIVHQQQKPLMRHKRQEHTPTSSSRG